ncbi:unnamed protein product [Vitrella brassicaformis CCMP3155]|uniref:EF-hand domain-containing protein n=3 Tax=Vitrella brassicaformis TaxID=1169539 RepID=A0A0G4EGP0_VITBC|nr:unnamed protein product [Vitrella brassicaformis CCMP3155]|eukprot:CEL95412.1 unnamed protein product [Vitrella brassicaformis CCMP3155]
MKALSLAPSMAPTAQSLATDILEDKPKTTTWQVLLEKFSECAFLTEVDEDGQHPLFPDPKRSEGGAHGKKGPLEEAHGALVEVGSGGAGALPGGEEGEGPHKGGDQLEILARVDQDRITMIKEEFLNRNNNVAIDEFVYIMKKYMDWTGFLDELREAAARNRRQKQEVSNPRQLQLQPTQPQSGLPSPPPAAPQPLQQDGSASGVLPDGQCAMSEIDEEEIEDEILEEDVDLHVTARLMDLFELIDIDGGKTMSWEELTGFIVDRGKGQDVMKEFSAIRLLKSHHQDDTPHAAHIERVYYFCGNGFDMLAFFEQGSRYLRLFTPELTPKKELRDQKAGLLAVAFIAKYSLLVTSCNDLSLTFYDTDNDYKVIKTFKARTSQLALCCSTSCETLFSGDHEGSIFAWDIRAIANPYEDSPTTHANERSAVGVMELWHKFISWRQIRQHLDIVVDLLELPSFEQLASCAMDKLVYIWDAATGELKRKLEGHERGVRTMCFSPANKLLITGGFDYQLFIWNPYVGKAIHTIKGHLAPIIKIESLGPGTGQVVSADTDGCIKTWDLTNYSCLQTIFVDEMPQLRSVAAVLKHKRIVCAGRKLLAFDFERTGVPEESDDHPLIKALYNAKLRIFMTAGGNHVRIWDASTGELKHSIQHKGGHEITDFCIDDRGRKLFVSDHAGNIAVYNASTGYYLRTLTKHRAEVSGLVYCPGDRCLLSVSWDKSLVVHDEGSEGSLATPKVWRRIANAHAGDITCCAYSRRLGLIATGSTDRIVVVWSYEKMKRVAELFGHQAEPTCLRILEPFPLLCSADQLGQVFLWLIPPHPLAERVLDNEARQARNGTVLLTRFLNLHSLESAVPIQCMDFFYQPPSAPQDAADPAHPSAATHTRQSDSSQATIHSSHAAGELTAANAHEGPHGSVVRLADAHATDGADVSGGDEAAPGGKRTTSLRKGRSRTRVSGADKKKSRVMTSSINSHSSRAPRKSTFVTSPVGKSSLLQTPASADGGQRRGALAHSKGRPFPVVREVPSGLRMLLFTGDEEGFIRVWDIGRLFRYDGIVPLEVKRDWYPHRVIYEDAREHSEMSVKAAAAAVSTSSRRSLETLCQGPVVARVRSWKAHTDAITSLEVVANANCILTAGYDRMAMTWALHKEGERIGALRQTPSDWHFPVRTDLSTIDAGKLKEVVEKVRELEMVEPGGGRRRRSWRKSSSRLSNGRRSSRELQTIVEADTQLKLGN